MAALEKLAALLPVVSAPAQTALVRAPLSVGEEALLEWGTGGEFGTPEEQTVADVNTIGFQTHKKHPKEKPPTYTFTEIRRKEVPLFLSVEALNHFIATHQGPGARFINTEDIPGVTVKLMQSVTFDGPKRVRGGLKQEKSSSVIEDSGTSLFKTRTDDDKEKQKYEFKFLYPDPWHKLKAVRVGHTTTE